MNALYRNGHAFTQYLRIPQVVIAGGKRKPLITIQVMGVQSLKVDRSSIIGEVDTGSAHTILTYTAARDMGIEPDNLPQFPGGLLSATGHRIAGTIGEVIIMIEDIPFPSIVFKVAAVFSKQIEDNLFGRDWLEKICIVMDNEAVHFGRG